VLRTDEASSVTATGADPQWWLVANPEAVVNPATVERLEQTLNAVLTEHPAEPVTAVYCDFELARGGELGEPVRVGAWSVERSRWQDYTGPAALIRADVFARVASTEALNSP